MSHKNSQIIKINNSTSKWLCYCIHPIGGGSYCYYPLAKQLENTCNCYGIQSIALEKNNQINTVEEMSNCYRAQLSILDDCPLILLGWSFGALIAYEIGRQLLSAGHKNIQIFMIDPYLFCDLNFDLLGINDPLADQNLLLKFYRDLIGVNTLSPAIKNKLTNCFTKEKEPQFACYEILCQHFNKLSQMGFEQIKTLYQGFKTHCFAYSQYQLSATKLSLTIFRCYELLPECNADPDRHWETLVKSYSINYLPGDHFSVFQEENLDIIVSAMLEKISQPSGISLV